MAKILGIDYGRAKIGLAIADSSLAEPLKVVRVNNYQDALDKIKIEIEAEKIEKVVVGVSENEMGQEQEKFAQELQERLSIPVETQEETLSTFDAQQMAIAAGISKKRRQELEDAFAASIMLQSYLDG